MFLVEIAFAKYLQKHNIFLSIETKRIKVISKLNQENIKFSDIKKEPANHSVFLNDRATVMKFTAPRCHVARHTTIIII